MAETNPEPIPPDPLAAQAQQIIDHVNEDHADALLLIAREIGGHTGADRAVAVGLDSRGIDVTIPPDTSPVRIAFRAPALDLMAAQTQMLRLVAFARARSGSGELTALERQVAERAAIRTFITRVTAVEQLGPELVQVTCGGGDLQSFAQFGPDQFLYVLAPPHGRTELTIDATFTWSGYEEMPPGERPVGAYYTVRRWRPDVAELDLVVVTHGDEGDGSRWARSVQAGNPVALWGPRRVFDPPPSTEHYLLVGDDTGVHAIAAILEWLPADAIVDVVVELCDVANDVPLRPGPNTTVTKLYRDGAPAGSAALLVAAVRARGWRAGELYAWGGAESRVMTAIRKYLRDERGMAREAVAMTAYWRRATADDADDAHED